jgi:branched-subunit amino acid transport protein AzlD
VFENQFVFATYETIFECELFNFVTSKIVANLISFCVVSCFKDSTMLCFAWGIRVFKKFLCFLLDIWSGNHVISTSSKSSSHYLSGTNRLEVSDAFPFARNVKTVCIIYFR